MGLEYLGTGFACCIVLYWVVLVICVCYLMFIGLMEASFRVLLAVCGDLIVEICRIELGIGLGCFVGFLWMCCGLGCFGYFGFWGGFWVALNFDLLHVVGLRCCLGFMIDFCVPDAFCFAYVWVGDLYLASESS